MTPAKRVVVLGNGPSLRDVEFSRLRREHTIAFNRAHLAFDDWGFDPTYYAAIDRNAIPQNRDAIERLIKMSSIRHFFLRDTARSLDLPHSDRVSFVRIGDHMRFSTCLEDLGMFGNVAAVSIQILAGLGYRRFLLLGVDGGYRDRSTVDELGTPYDLQARQDDDHDHFRSDYHGAGIRFTRPNNKRFLDGWRALAVEAASLGLEIVHGSPASAVDCFCRLEFETAWNVFVRH